MDPHLGSNDKLMFYKYLDKASVYFEYGSGGSTYQAATRTNIKKIYSVESDNAWHNHIKSMYTSNNIDFIYNEMCTAPNDWGQPGPGSTPTQRKAYSNHMRSLLPFQREALDLVFIDGRFRVACCLKCFDIISLDCFIAFDDFLDRAHYHVVLAYYDIVEQTLDNRMVILQKKKGIFSVPSELIELYEDIKGHN